MSCERFMVEYACTSFGTNEVYPCLRRNAKCELVDSAVGRRESVDVQAQK